MSDARERLIAVMRAELRRQSEEGPGRPYVSDKNVGPLEIKIDGEIDLAALAEAILAEKQ